MTPGLMRIDSVRNGQNVGRGRSLALAGGGLPALTKLGIKFLQCCH